MTDIIIYGLHSRDWMDALGARAAVWKRLPNVGRVSVVDDADPPDAADDRRDRVIIPLMERHAVSCPRIARSLFSDPSAIAILGDKGAFADYMRAGGLEDLGPTTFADGKVEFPCILKRLDLNAGIGVALIESPDHLEQLLEREPWRDAPYLLQQYVAADFDFCTHGVYRDGELLHHCTYRYRVNAHNPVQGAANPTVPRRSWSSAETLSALNRCLVPLKYSGPANFDYRFDQNGHLKILEINPRLGGSLMSPIHIDDLSAILGTIIAHAR